MVKCQEYNQLLKDAEYEIHTATVGAKDRYYKECEKREIAE